MELYPEVSPRLFDRLLSMLVYEGIQINRERGNSGAGRTVCFGTVSKRCLPTGPSRWNNRRPDVWAELQKIAQSLPVPEGWTSCVVNQDFACLPHYDSGNVGPSLIVSFGCYTGGELVLEDASGCRTSVSTFLRPIVGDFSKTRHWTRPLSGVKFSLVYFTLQSAGSKKRRKQKPLTAEEVMSYVDPEYMFNPVPGVSRANKNGRTYVEVVTPNPPWSGLTNPKLWGKTS